ncbi:hypothetical protein B0H14DRAFT_3500024 [Mycena olivaceomarginata]|nr:hypothetical protein B0H14DRAFT_3500024 [Mycena olivaceomarginata]
MSHSCPVLRHCSPPQPHPTLPALPLQLRPHWHCSTMCSYLHLPALFLVLWSRPVPCALSAALQPSHHQSSSTSPPISSFSSLSMSPPLIIVIFGATAALVVVIVTDRMMAVQRDHWVPAWLPHGAFLAL